MVTAIKYKTEREVVAKLAQFGLSLDEALRIVRAELSLPYRIADSNFAGFIERIFIVDGGDWAGSGIVDLDDDEPALEFEPIISKK